MTWIAPVGILIAVGLIIYLSMKGYSIVFIGPLCALVVILLNGMDIFGALISLPNSFMMGLGKYIVNYFGVFLLGSILAKYIEESGAAISIAKSIMKVTGTEKPYSVLIAIFLISSLLTYGGVSLFVVMFAIIPLSRPIFKEMNMSWSLVTIPIMLGIGTFTMTMLPGTPSIQNVVPTTYLHTSLTAAPLLGIIGSVVAIAFGLWYMKYELNKSIKNAETYAPYAISSTAVTVGENKTPNIVMSIAPLVVLIVIVLAGSIMKVSNIILIGLVIAAILSAIIFKDYIGSQKSVINAGAQGAIIPIFFTAATVGFGTVIISAPGFKIISNAILNIPGSPLISLSIANCLMGAITGSASGALGIILPAFAQHYVAMGISPDVIHRVSAIAAASLTGMPQAGAVLSFFALAGLNHKNSFKKLFIIVNGSNLLALIVVVAVAITIY